MAKIYKILLKKFANSEQLESKPEITQEIAIEKLDELLKKNKAIIRTSIDNSSPKKSITILIDDQKEVAPQLSQLFEFIRQCGIECEMLEANPETILLDHEYDAHQDSHDHDECEECDGHEHEHEHQHTEDSKHHLNHEHSQGKEEHSNHTEEHPKDHYEREEDEGSKHGQGIEPLFYVKYNKKPKKTSLFGRIKNWWSQINTHKKKGIFGIAWGVGLFVLSIFSGNLPGLGNSLTTIATAVATLYCGKEVYEKAFTSKKLNMSSLYTISTLTIVGISILSFFIPGLPSMCEAAPLILGLWHIGEVIEHSLKKKVEKQLDIRDCAPKKVSLIGAKNVKSEVSVCNLIPNDIIIVPKGKVIPVDGELLDDEVNLYTHRINGNCMPNIFKKGTTVLAGMQLPDDQESIRIRVRQTFQRSYLSRVAENIKDASKQKAPIEILTNKVLKYFVPGLLATAVISGIIIGILFNPPLAIQCAISVLVSACPCALSLVTPLAVKIGMNKAAEKGVNFKNGKTLQAAADINTVVFDLNGTLTRGKPKVTGYKIFNKNISKEKFFQYIEKLESVSKRPLAKIIHEFVARKDLTKLPPLNIQNIDESHHAGIRAKIDGEEFIIGNNEILAKNHIIVKNPSVGAIYLVKGKEVIGQITVLDPLRNDAKRTIKELRNQGKTIHLCTGADDVTAKYYANVLGIDHNHVKSHCKDTEKTEYITKLRNDGLKVAMIGDAINDAAAIRNSHFGIAMKSSLGDEITEQQAGAVVKNNLMPIVTAFEVAKQTKRNIWQNLMISLTYNSTITLVAAGLFVALGFALNPAIGIALVVVETTLVLANAYRFKNQIVSKIENDTSQNAEISNEKSTHSRLSHVFSPTVKKKLKPDLEKNPITNSKNSELKLFSKSKDSVDKFIPTSIFNAGFTRH